MLLVFTLASALLLPNVPYHAAAHANPRGHVFCCSNHDPPELGDTFLDLMTKGGMAVQGGEMGRALSFFKAALALEPTAATTQAMVKRLEGLGIEPTPIDEEDVS